MKAQNINKEGVITNTQTRVLEELARYGYLTFSQMLELKVGVKHYQNLWKQVAALRDRRRALVKCHNFSTPQPKKGRVESLYCLTNYGKKVLVNDIHLLENEIKVGSNRTVAYKDYHHRKQTIDFQICLNNWVRNFDASVPFFDTYFERAKKNGKLRAKTRIDLANTEYIIPDASFQVNNGDKERFYLFELHRGQESSRIIKQIDTHAKCLTYRFTHKQYNVPEKISYKILLVFELNGTKENVIKRLKKEGVVFKNIQKYFLLKTLQDLKEPDFGKDWRSLFGETIPFFP